MTTILILNIASALLGATGVAGFVIRGRRARRRVEVLYVTTRGHRRGEIEAE